MLRQLEIEAARHQHQIKQCAGVVLFAEGGRLQTLPASVNFEDGGPVCKRGQPKVHLSVKAARPAQRWIYGFWPALLEAVYQCFLSLRFTRAVIRQELENQHTFSSECSGRCTQTKRTSGLVTKAMSPHTVM